jgi:pimeloyl-ACP methyl ester carboxylesterase
MDHPDGRAPVADPAPEPAEAAALRSGADRLETPCGDGHMVWHAWGAGPAIVLLHGGYGSWTHWIRNIDPLRRSFRVVAPDLPGLGDSAIPPEPYTPGSLARILANGLDEILPDDAYHLVGFSFGALLAGPLAVYHEARVRGLTLVAASGLGLRRPPIPLETWRHLDRPADRAVIHARNLAALMFRDPALIDDLAIRLQAYNAERARIKSRPIARTTALAETLPSIRAPLSAIYGESDIAALPDVRDRERQLRASHPELDFRLIPSAGHWVQYETPMAFDAALLELARERLR